MSLNKSCALISNDKQYWENQFASCLEQKMKLAQASFFFECFRKMIPEKFLIYCQDKQYSCCDFGCGLGNFTNNLYEIFPKFEIYGVDFSANAINYAKKHFSKVSFLEVDLDNLSDDFDIMITSNTLEHFSNPQIVVQKLLKHTKKYLIMLVPYEERDLYEEHLFDFERDFFNANIGNFDLMYLKSIDLSAKFNTMWLGKQIMAIYKSKDIITDFPYEEHLQQKDFNFINKVNYKINLWRRNLYRCLRRCLINKRKIIKWCGE